MSFGEFALGGTASILQGMGTYIAADKKAKSDRKWQEYNNKMVRLQDGLNQNSLTTNENMLKERAQTKKVQIQMSEYSTTASAEVAAAASGTVGRSVDMVLFDIGRNAAGARARVDKDTSLQEDQIEQQRLQSALAAETSINYKSIPGPSAATAMLGVAADLGKLWKSTGAETDVKGWFK